MKDEKGNWRLPVEPARPGASAPKGGKVYSEDELRKLGLVMEFNDLGRGKADVVIRNET